MPDLHCNITFHFLIIVLFFYFYFILMVYRKQLDILNAKIKEQHQEIENVQELVNKSVSYTKVFSTDVKVCYSISLKNDLVIKI